MARRRILTAKTLPQAGTIYAVALPTGRWGACRVLQTRTPAQATAAHEREYIAFVAALLWQGDASPTLSDVAVVGPLRSCSGEIRGVWIGEPPDDRFQHLGVAQAGNVFEHVPRAFSGWDWIMSVLSSAPVGPSPGSEPQPRMVELFADWAGHVSVDAIRLSRQIIADLEAGLSQLGRAEAESARLALVRRAIRRFNDLNHAAPWITTLEREDICSAICRTVVGAGGIECQAQIDRWRKW